MIDWSWRDAIWELRRRISESKAQGITTVDINRLESSISDIEDDFLLNYEHQLLNHINDPSACYNQDFNRSIDRYAKALAREHQEHKAYTQLVVTAGYVTFFALWALTKELYSPLFHTLAVISISISAAVFVIFEVIKMTIIATGYDFKYKLLIKAKIEDEINNRIQALNDGNAKDDWLRIVLARVWIRTLILSVFFGLLGIGLLFYSFMSILTEQLKTFI